MVGTAIVAVIAVSAVWVYLDATGHRIGKIPDQGGFFNLSAGAWGAGTLLLWIVGFPAYLMKRGSLIARAKSHPIEVKGRWAKTMIFCVIGILWLLATLLG